jgi:tRNA (guanine37-N1)-methyltransferase
MKQSLGRTWRRRPDLLANVSLSEEQVALLEEYKLEEYKLELTKAQEQSK